MIEVKQNFVTGLDLDTGLLNVPKTSYVDSMNITRDNITASSDFVVTNVVGNQEVQYEDMPSGTNKCIGYVANDLRKTIVYFLYNSNSNHSILQFNTVSREITKIFENLTDSNSVDILGFTENGKITSVNIYNNDEGDLLFFLDSLGRPTFLNITRFIAGEYTPVTREIIDVALIWPSVAPSCVYDNVVSVTSNYLNNRLFKFQQVWINDEDMETVGSPVSATALPNKILDATFTNTITNNNVIRVSLSSGPKNIKAVKLLMSYAEKENIWRDFVEVATIDKSKQSISDDVSFVYNFFNDGTYPTAPVERRIQLQDYVPLEAKSQEMPFGNYLGYGGITEGFDNTITPSVTLTVNTVAAGSGQTVGSLNGVVTSLGFTRTITFSGIPATGTVVQIFILVGGVTNSLAGTYTTVAGDTPTQVAAGLDTSLTAIGIALIPIATGDQIAFLLNFANGDTFGSLVITVPTSAATLNSIATWFFLDQKNIGLAYYDEQGRTAGVFWSNQVVFPAYAENGSAQVLLPYINAKIFHRPPEFAHSYGWVINKGTTNPLYFECVDVITTDPKYLYFDITNLALNQKNNPTTAQVVSWEFQSGDRFRLIRRMADGNVFNSTFDALVEGIVTSPNILNTTYTDRTFIKILRLAPFAAQNYASKFFIFQLYRPAQPQANVENLPFFEFGQNYPILDAETSDRRHGGMVTDQSADLVTPAEFNFYNGDAYFRQRTVYLSDTGFGTFNVQDRNFVDFYISAVNSLDGRATAIEPNTRERFLQATIRASLEVQPNTDVNKLNQFTAANFIDCSYNYGIVERMVARDKFLRVYQTNKIGRIPLFSTVGRAPTGSEVVINTDTLLNPIIYSEGNYGIGTMGMSLVSFNFADYLVDNIRNVVLRVSQDGATPISVLYKINSFCVQNFPSYTNIYGAFDQKTNNYIFAMEGRETGSTGVVAYKTCAGVKTVAFVPFDGETELCAQTGYVILLTAGMTQSIVNDYNCGSPNCTRYRISNAEVPSYTLSFDEDLNSFESFLSFHPEWMGTLGTLFMSWKNGKLYTHDNFSDYNTFYGEYTDPHFTPVFNENGLLKKTWTGINQIASGVWDVPLAYTNVNDYPGQRQETNLVEVEFTVQEQMPSASFKRSVYSRGGKVNGSFMKGNWIAVKLRKQNATELVSLSLVSVKSLDSAITPK